MIEIGVVRLQQKAFDYDFWDRQKYINFRKCKQIGTFVVYLTWVIGQRMLIYMLLEKVPDHLLHIQELVPILVQLPESVQGLR